MHSTAAARKDARKRRKTPNIFQGVDLEQEAWRYCQALGFVRNVELIIKHNARPGNTHGRQWCMVTTIYIGHDEHIATVLQMLLHEICHVRHMNHSEDFITLMVQTAQAVWGLDIDGWQDVPQGKAKHRAYAVDSFLRKRLLLHLESKRYLPVFAGTLCSTDPKAPTIQPTVCGSLADLLEFTLWTYETLCDANRQPVRELERHERQIETTFMQMASFLKAGIGAENMIDPPHIRVRRILGYVDRGDSPKEAVRRFFNVFRYKMQTAHLP